MVWFCSYSPTLPDGSMGDNCGTKFSTNNGHPNQVRCPTCNTSGSVCCIAPYISRDYVRRDLT